MFKPWTQNPKYDIYSDGRIFSHYSNKFLKPTKEKYLTVNLKPSDNATGTKYLMHRIIAETFIANPNNYPLINHKDENTYNNDISNLEWCDYKYNNNYGSKTQRISDTVKQRYQEGILSQPKREKNSKARKIIMCDKNTHTEIKQFDCIMSAIDYLQLNENANSNIVSCAKGRKKSAYGYWWKYNE